MWGWLGFNVIIYLAALQGIPGELVEAAAIDGASAWGSFRSVTFPLLGPTTLFLTVWSTITALQLFDEVYFLTKGGPLYSTYVVVYYVDGKQRKESARTYEDARRLKAARESDVARGEFHEDSAPAVLWPGPRPSE